MMFRADPNFGYSPGEWRRGEIEITGATIKPVHWSKIEEKIETLIEIINDPEENLIRKTAVAHNFFEQVHPFPDGNGRVGRILMNFILVGHGFPNIAIKGKEQDRKIYIAALEEGDPIVAPMIKNSTSKIVRPLVKLEDLINKSLAIAMDVVICNRFEKIKNLMTTNQLAAAIARPVTSVRVACSQKKFICANIAGKIMSHPDLLETPNPRDFLQRA